eukprot:12391409-Karenia_brevis.AAC.1
MGTVRQPIAAHIVHTYAEAFQSQDSRFVVTACDLNKILAMPRQSYTSQRMRAAAERSVADFHRS